MDCGSSLRSKTPDLVRQEFYGLVIAHYAIRKLMQEASLGLSSGLLPGLKGNPPADQRAPPDDLSSNYERSTSFGNEL